MPDHAEPPLISEVRGPALWLTFNRPHRLNAATPEMEDLIVRACESVAESPDIRVVVFAGATGRKSAFMAGADTDTFGSVSTEADVSQVEAHSERTLTVIEDLPIPTIAVLDGAVVGQGALIASCCDVLLCGPDVKFGFPIARTVGNCLSTKNLMRLVRLVGRPYVRSMIMRARLLTGQELAAAGATLDVAESTEELWRQADRTAETIASLAPLTLRGTKETLRRDMRTETFVDNADLVNQAYLSQDSREALAAFAEKRSPRWTGR